MNTAYVVASTLLFTLAVIGNALAPYGKREKIGLALSTAFATFGWICVVRIFG